MSKRFLDTVLIPADGSPCTMLKRVPNTHEGLSQALFGKEKEAAQRLGDKQDWYTETVRIAGPDPRNVRYLIIDESSAIKNMPRNIVASYELYPGIIFGNALLVRGNYERELADANEDDLAWVERLRQLVLANR